MATKNDVHVFNKILTPRTPKMHNFSDCGAQVVAVLGAQWGDEGKGKLVDILASEADICCRFNGGSNAGHTLVVDGKKHALHLLPCGFFYPKCKNLIGNGVVVHLKTLMKELEDIKEAVPDAIQRLAVSNRAHILFDFHQTVDGLIEAEKAKSGNSIGTTKKGIGPCYASKAARTGVRVCDLLYWDEFEQKYMRLLEDFQKRFNFQHDHREELDRHKAYLEKLRPCIVDSVAYLYHAMKRGDSILIEGANAIMLDLDFGTYPYVTSSSTSAGGMCTGLGVPPQCIDCSVGVVKAYTTRVGEGPFPTELKDAVCEHLQQVGKEFGTTTGRKRRCGWLDIPVVKYASVINGFTCVNMTKLDVLTGLPELKIGFAYKNKKGETLPPGYFPAHLHELADVEVVYETLPGWTEPLNTCTSFEQLPLNAQKYIKRVEQLLELPISWVGVGPDRVNTINIKSQ